MTRRQLQRTTKATDILPLVQANIECTRRFFENDHSLLLSKFIIEPRVDPRVVGLLPTLDGETAMEAQHRRLVISEHIALKEEEWIQQEQGLIPADLDRLPNCYRQGPDFLRSEGLGKHKDYVSIGLGQGRRSRRIQRKTDIDGISFALLPVYSQLSHLTLEEESVLIHELVRGDYEDILQLARDLSPLAAGYRFWISEEIKFRLLSDLG